MELAYYDVKLLANAKLYFYCCATIERLDFSMLLRLIKQTSFVMKPMKLLNSQHAYLTFEQLATTLAN